MSALSLSYIIINCHTSNILISYGTYLNITIHCDILLYITMQFIHVHCHEGGRESIILHYHKLPHIILYYHILSYSTSYCTSSHIIHCHTLYIVMRGSVSQLWEIGDKIGEIFQPTPSLPLLHATFQIISRNLFIWNDFFSGILN